MDLNEYINKLTEQMAAAEIQRLEKEGSIFVGIGFLPSELVVVRDMNDNSWISVLPKEPTDERLG